MTSQHLDVARCVELPFYNKYKMIIDDLIDKTIYFTKDQVCQAIEQQIKEWLNSYDMQKKLYVLVSPKKVGSEHWIYRTFEHLLPEHTLCLNPNMFCITDFENSEILIMDDWCLSGTHASNILMNYIIDPEEPNGTDSPFPELTANVTYIFAIMNYIMPEWFIESFNYFPNLRINVHGKYLIKPFGEICELDITPTLLYKFEREIGTYTINGGTGFPVHLEYKIANKYSSYPTIYSKLRNEPDRNFMKPIIESFKTYNNKAITLGL